MADVVDAATFASAMERLKLTSELSYREIARRSGLPRSTVSDLCQGNRKAPPPTVHARAFLSALGIDGEALHAWLETLSRIRLGDPAGNERYWLRRAALDGDPFAMFRLAAALRAEGHDIEAGQWLRRAATGHAAAMNLLGTLHRKEGRLGDAELWWRRAARAGDADAMNNVALLLQIEEELAAEEWFRRAAMVGSLDAMNDIAALLEERGDVAEAEQWYGMAARAGDTDAPESLAAMHQARGDLTQAGVMKQIASVHRTREPD